MERMHVIVRGLVQGVCFRAATREEARGLGLTGWVRTLPDESVELVAEGDPAALARLAEWCHRGPPHAFVESVEERRSPATGEFSGFRITW